MYWSEDGKRRGAGEVSTSRESRGLYISSHDPPVSVTRKLAIDVKSRTLIAYCALLGIALV